MIKDKLNWKIKFKKQQFNAQLIVQKEFYLKDICEMANTSPV